MSRRTIALTLTLVTLAAIPLAAHAASGGAAVDRVTSFPSMDRELARMNRQIPGFGGLFFDSAGRATAYLTDPADARARALLGPDVRILRGRFEVEDLLTWRRALRPAVLAIPGVVLLDVDEAVNRVRIGVAPDHLAAARLQVAAEAAGRGVPEAALVVEATDPIVEMATLRDVFRPVPGGVEIATGSQFIGYSVCSLGFNAVRDGVSGFVTASHCTITRGSVDGSRFLQPFGILPGTSEIATETVDPPYLRGIAGCPGGRMCRYSDSAFAAYDSASLSDFGHIARTTSRSPSAGPLTIDAANPTFAVTATSSSAVGEELNKIGRTTGWTYGTVTSTCADVAVSGSKIVLLCQDTVDAGVGGGDSGSPVFAWGGGASVSLRGILWGGDEAGTFFVYSPIANIVRTDELGPLVVH